MSIRPLFIALAATLAFPLAAAAQSAPPPAVPAQAAPAQAAPAHHHVRFMDAVRSLSLTPDQQQKIAAFTSERAQANAGADAPTRHANAKKFRHEIVGILTPDQRAQLRAAMTQAMTAPAPQ